MTASGLRRTDSVGLETARREGSVVVMMLMTMFGVVLRVR